MAKPEQKCHQIPREECKPISRQEPREHCHPVPKKHCRQIPQSVPKEECIQVGVSSRFEFQVGHLNESKTLRDHLFEMHLTFFIICLVILIFFQALQEGENTFLYT